MTPSSDIRIHCRGIGKRFGGETALAGVEFELRRGEIHGLIGSNGAGKSTLMRILAGALPDHEGTIELDGKPVALSSPREAAARGIAMVHQELSNVGQLSIAENVVLGRQPIRGPFRRLDWKKIRKEAREALEELGLSIDVRRRMDSVPLVTQQMVEIARGLHSGAGVLILDEPTSALSPPEIARLFDLLRKLKTRDVSVIFISHFIEDVLNVCDRVTVLRDGEKIETVNARRTDRQKLITSMLGTSDTTAGAEATQTVTLRKRPKGQAVLYAEAFARHGEFGPVNMSVLPGECLGLYGFVGAGHQELVRCIAGATSADEGFVFTDGSRLPVGRPDRVIDRGVVFVGADRTETLIREFPIHENTTMAYLRRAVGRLYTKRKSVRVSKPILERVGCKPADPLLRAGALSGGNQQKVVFGKWLLGPMRVLLLEEPTRGMDVGAKEEVLALVRALKEDGVGVILASTEPELMLSEADRVLVFHRGRIAKEFVGEPVSKASLMRVAGGS